MGRKKTPKSTSQPLTVSMILDWADKFHREHGRWPNSRDQYVPSAPGESWIKIQGALQTGGRGLRGSITLPRLLEKHRGVRPYRSALTEQQILDWAKIHFKERGEWPSIESGDVIGAPSETWTTINAALTGGRRGLKRGSSLVRLFKKHGIVRPRKQRPKLDPADILRWADAFFAAYGYWPYARSGPVAGVPKANWRAIDVSLRLGNRGLPGGSSLSDFLNEHRGIFEGRQGRIYRISDERRIDMKKVMSWARAYRKKTGIWPHLGSGEIPGSGGYRWGLVDMALRFGRRGLPGGTSLARLFGHKKKKKPKKRRKKSAR